MVFFNPFSSDIHHIGVFSLANNPDDFFLTEGLKQLNIIPGTDAIYSKPEGIAVRKMAATDDNRVRAFHRLLANPEIDLLLAARGGFGTTRTLDYIDWQKLRQRNLPVIGYSDLTAFNLAALRYGCNRQIQGPMLCSQWGNKEYQSYFIDNMQSLKNCIDGGKDLLPPWHHAETIKSGHCTGYLIPANFTTLMSLAGTPYFPNLTNAVLLLEDVNEPAHHIDRMLNQLKQMGILAQLSGLIFGQFTICEDAEFIPEIIQEYAVYIHGPVIWNLQFGHTKRNISFPVGKLATLSAAQNQITLELSDLEQYQPKLFILPSYQLPYRFLEPELIQPTQKYPLVLFLHGVGERGINNQKQTKNFADLFVRPELRKKYPCFVCCPQCPDNEQWCNAPWNENSHRIPVQKSNALIVVDALIDKLCEKYPIDPKRIYIMGLSMGGFGTWDAICRNPERFAAAVPICGGADLTYAPKLTSLPIWAFHGAEDRTVSPDLTRKMVTAIRKAGGTKIRYTEYSGIGHDSWTSASKEPELLKFVFAQHQ